MSKYNIIYNKNYHSSPLSFWVHHDMESEIWEDATKYEPELPKAIVSKGYPMLVIDALGHELRFSSIQEVEHFIEVIKQKNMPTSSQLASKRPKSTGLNSHWLSRLPAKLKPWRNRKKYIPIIEDGLIALKKIYI
jgi:hypothetical protein